MCCISCSDPKKEYRVAMCTHVFSFFFFWEEREREITTKQYGKIKNGGNFFFIR